MRRPSKFRRILKWLTLATGLLLLAAWGLNYRWYLDAAGRGLFLQLRDGHALLNYDRAYVGRTRGFLLNNAYGETTHYRADIFFRSMMMGTRPAGSTVEFELWYPAAAFLLLAALLWWRDRRYPRGTCQQCGYNLTGNTSGICPECGHASSGACNKSAG